MKKKILITNLSIIIILIVALNQVLSSITVDDTINLTSPNSTISKKQKEDKTPITPIDSTKEEKNLSYESKESNTGGILPAVAIVRCRWKKTKDGAEERTIHFWVRGRGRHVIEWQIWNDFDGDGNWDLWGPNPPIRKKWTALLFPIRHFSDRVSWNGYLGHPKVMVKYWLDGRAFTKTFSLK